MSNLSARSSKHGAGRVVRRSLLTDVALELLESNDKIRCPSLAVVVSANHSSEDQTTEAMQPCPRYPPALQAGAILELLRLAPSHPRYRASCCEANKQLRASKPLKFTDVLDSASLFQLLSSVPGGRGLAPASHDSTHRPQHNQSSEGTLVTEKRTVHIDEGADSTVGENHPLPVWCTDSARHRFIVCDEAKNVFGSDYHVRVPEARKLTMPISEIRHCVRSWTSSRLLLQLDLFQLSCSRPGLDPGSYPGKDIPSAPAALCNTLRDLLAAAPCKLHASVLPAVKQCTWVHNLQDTMAPFWTWLRTSFLSDYWPLGGAPYSSAVVSLEWGATGALLPARYDMADRLLLQVSGHRRVLLLPPDAAFRGLAPFPTVHPYDCYSSPMVALTSLSADQDMLPQLRSMQELWPDFEKVNGPGTVLGPGEVLFVPAGWFLHSEMVSPDQQSTKASCGGKVQQQTGQSNLGSDVENSAVMVRLFAAAEKSVLPRPALALQLSRHLEEWCAAELTGEGKLRRLVLGMAQYWRQQQQPTCGGDGRLCPDEPLGSNTADPDQAASSSSCSVTTRQRLGLFADASTLKGYKLLRLWELCVTHVSAIVGNESGPKFLEQMCDSRLLPTDWLNKMCRDTLVLAEKQFWYDDVRTQHEIDYPELFRMQIQNKDTASKATTLRPAHTKKDLFLPWTTAGPVPALEQ